MPPISNECTEGPAMEFCGVYKFERFPKIIWISRVFFHRGLIVRSLSFLIAMFTLLLFCLCCAIPISPFFLPDLRTRLPLLIIVIIIIINNDNNNYYFESLSMRIQ